VEKPKGKRPHGGGRILELNIKMELQEIGSEDVDWIDLAQADSSKRANEPSGSIGCGNTGAPKRREFGLQTPSNKVK